MKDLTLCVVCVILGILLSTIFKQMCGCKNTVEGMHAIWHGGDKVGPPPRNGPPNFGVKPAPGSESGPDWSSDHQISRYPHKKEREEWLGVVERCPRP